MWAFGNGVEAIKVAALWVLSEPGKPASLSSNTQWSLSLPVRTTGVQVPTQATRRLCWQWRRSGLCSPSCWWRVTSACVPTHHMDTVVSVIIDHLLSVHFSWSVSKRTEKSLQHMLVVYITNISLCYSSCRNPEWWRYAEQWRQLSALGRGGAGLRSSW